LVTICADYNVTPFAGNKMGWQVKYLSVRINLGLLLRTAFRLHIASSSRYLSALSNWIFIKLLVDQKFMTDQQF
jgi:hypothetical protein